MKKDNFIKKIFLNIKYFKNDCIIKYKVAKRDGFKKKSPKNSSTSKANNEAHKQEITFKDESTFSKTKTSADKSKGKISSTPRNIDFKNVILGNVGTLTIGLLIIIGSFFISNNLFDMEKQYRFYNVTQESENRILNILKSPKTNVSIESYPIDNKGVIDVKKYFNIVDSLDSYTYKISFDEAGDYLSNELWKFYMSKLKPINKMNNIDVKNVYKYNNFYIINDVYKIESKNVDSSYMSNILEKNIQSEIKLFNNYRNIEVALITISIAIIGNLIFFYIKKVISKK